MPLLMVLAFPSALHALDFTYTTTSGAVSITGYTGAGGAVAIPDTINGLPVTAIGNGAFSGKKAVTSVSIPASVTSIGGSAFASCSGLKSINIPASVSYIGWYAFTNCTAMTAITVSSGNLNYSSVGGILYDKSLGELIVCPAGKVGSVNIPSGVTHIRISGFENSAGLTSVTIPASVTYIDTRAFENCTGLTTVTIPASVTYMGNDTFTGCTGLTSVSIAAKLGRYAFSGCSNLTTVNILAGASGISKSEFPGCSKLSAFTAAASSAVYSSLNGVLFNKDQSTLILFPIGKTGAYVIPTSVTSIGDEAFSDCSGLTSVTIPNSVTSIGSHGFYYCSGLTSVTIPNGVTSIGSHAFYGCRDISSVTIPNSVTSVGVYAFAYCDSLTSVTIPSSITSIVDGMFDECGRLTDVTIPNSVTSIGSYAFSACGGLTSILIPAGVISIGDSAFTFCDSLESTIFLGNAPSIQAGYFGVFHGAAAGFTVYFDPSKTGFTTPTWQGYPAVALPATAEIAVEQPAETNLVDGMTSVAFGWAKVGTNVVKTFTVRNMGTANLTGLAVTKDGSNAADFVLGEFGTTSLPPWTSTTFTVAFAPESEGAKTVAIQISSNDTDENPFDISLTGTTIPFTYEITGGKITITRYIGSGGAVVIPSTIEGLPVTGIGDIAFSERYNVTSVAIPPSVTNIGESAFYGCSGLTSVTIPASVTGIGDYAFCESGLTKVTVPNSVTSIGCGAFSLCNSLASVTVPSSVTSIGSYAFLGCEKLTQITVDALNPNYSSLDGVFFNKSRSLLIQCSAGKAGIYAIPDSVTSIESQAFFGCSALTGVTIPSSVTSIGTYAFYDCSGLESAIFLGDAPTMQFGVFFSAPASFKVYFISSKTGFATPTWQGYAAVALSTFREIVVTGPSGAGITDGGSAQSFGEVYPGKISRSVFTIRNLGATSLTGLAITKNGANASDFAVSSLSKTVLAPGAETTFMVSFAPAAPGSRAAAIHIASNDADENPFDITLSGTGIGNPEIEIQQPAGTDLKDGVSTKSFGSVAVKSSASKTFTIRNTGTAKLTGLAITKTGANSKDFSVKAPLMTSLAPGASTTFKVIFKPSAKGIRKAFIHIKSNDSNENPFDIALTGKGTAGSAAQPSLAQSRRVLPRSDRGIHPSIDAVRLSDGRKYLTLTIVKPGQNLLLKPTVEVSPNLVDWYSGKNHTTVITDDESLLKVRDNTPLSPGSKRYIRIKASGLR